MGRNASAKRKASDIDLTGIGAYESLMTHLQQRLDPFGVMTSIILSLIHI